MPASGLELSSGSDVARAPKPRVLWAVGLACIAGSVGSVALALASDHLVRPGLQAFLVNWITIPFIVSGLIAWWRRPDSRFGPLMIAAGFVIGLSTLQWANASLPYTAGQLLDLLPPVLFLHVCLAFPTGRLERRPERLVVAAAYLTAVVLQVVKMLLGIDPANLLDVVAQPALAANVELLQLVIICGLLLAGVALLAVRRRKVAQPTRRPLALLVDAFGLGLLMLVLLFVAGLRQWPAQETIRHLRFAVLGLAPIAFLVGLLDARLARSDVGTLLVQLRANPAPDLRAPLARALHDPSLTVAYWLPQFGSWATRSVNRWRYPARATGGQPG